MQDISKPSKIKIYVKKTKSIYENIMLIAFDPDTTKVEAIGRDAERFLEYPAEKMVVVSPLRQGLISEYICFQKAIKIMMQEALHQKKFLFKPKVLISLPNDIPLSEVDIKAFEDAVYQSGAGNVTFTTVPFEEAVEKMAPNDSMVIGVIMEEKGEFLKERLKDIVEYAKFNHIEREQVLRLMEQVYKR